MPYISADFISRHTDFADLVEVLRAGFQAGGVEVPPRHHHAMPHPDGGAEGTLLLMPAWQPGQDLGMKMVTVQPDNAQLGLPAIQGSYLYCDAQTGVLKAVLEAKALTAKRTAAASALASSFLSRSATRTMLMIGTGALAPQLIRAHAAVRPLEKVYIWGRRPERAEELAAELTRMLAEEWSEVQAQKSSQAQAEEMSRAQGDESLRAQGKESLRVQGDESSRAQGDESSQILEEEPAQGILEKTPPALRQESISHTLEIIAISKIEEVVSEVDLISCATLSVAPLVFGKDLRPGQHVDLVGAYKPNMRESDDEAVRRSRVFLDTLEAGLKESGDIALPLANGSLKPSDIQSDLFDLCRRGQLARNHQDEITLFKSVGHALEDLLAARYYYRKFTQDLSEA